jgi:hypothetical protein
MNYLKVYCNLIRKAENRTPPEGYTEKHHTFPKSIFGKNNRLVVLTAREHYIAHALLEKIYIKRYGLKDKRTIKMTYAFSLMNSYTNKNDYCNSILYEGCRIRYSNIQKNKKLTEKHRECLRVGKKGKLSYRYGKKHTLELKLKWSLERGKDFQILSPEGKIVSDNNIYKFCEKHNLSKSSINSVVNGKCKCHKGWRNISYYGKTEYELKLGNEFVIKSPNGQIIKSKNISEFCRLHNLHTGHFCAVLKNKNKSHKGWTLP